ncbi:MAG: alpha/beta hydrolase [Candidatus Diapherotrites archaeon]|nr:alpha/beta hydrolase [Candidatus Diapherotrites archaeon]
MPEKIRFGDGLSGLWYDMGADKTIIECLGLGSVKGDAEHSSRAEAFNAAGFNALVYDYFGRGESVGDWQRATLSRDVEDLSVAIDFVDTLVGVFGSSYGADVALLAATKDKRIRALALRSPAADTERWQGEWSSSSGLSPSESFQKDAPKHNCFSAIKRVRVPILIIHGDADTTVRPAVSQKLYESARDPKRLVLIKGAGHLFEGKDDLSCRRLAVHWFREWL